MEINIINKFENHVLSRTELKFECEYQGEPTPTIIDVKSKVVALEDANKKLLVVDTVKPSYGVGKAIGFAKIYTSIEKLEEIETKSIIEKNKEPEKPAEEETTEEETAAEEPTEE